MAQKSLLDALSEELQCDYLSDLRYLTAGQRYYLARKLADHDTATNSLAEWNEVLDYLENAPPEQTVERAKAHLIALLSRQ